MTREEFIGYVEDMQKSLRRFLLALCEGNREDADDLAQDTFVKAYLACDSFRDNKKFRTWIYKIAYHSFINYKRRQRTMPLDEPSDMHGLICEPEDKFRYEDLYKALSLLSPKEKMAILLYYMEGYDIKEIAEITDCSDAAVRQQLSRGRNDLKKILGH